MHLAVEDGGALSRLVVEDLVGEGHALVVVIDRADTELEDVLVQREAGSLHSKILGWSRWRRREYVVHAQSRR